MLRTLNLGRVRQVLYIRTRKGWHLLVEHSRNLTAAETVCCQFALGSDRLRELLNTMRMLRLDNAPEFWQKRFNILYSEKLR